MAEDPSCGLRPPIRTSRPRAIDDDCEIGPAIPGIPSGEDSPPRDACTIPNCTSLARDLLGRPNDFPRRPDALAQRRSPRFAGCGGRGAITGGRSQIARPPSVRSSMIRRPDGPRRPEGFERFTRDMWIKFLCMIFGPRIPRVLCPRRPPRPRGDLGVQGHPAGYGSSGSAPSKIVLENVSAGRS